MNSGNAWERNVMTKYTTDEASNHNIADRSILANSIPNPTILLGTRPAREMAIVTMLMRSNIVRSFLLNSPKGSVFSMSCRSSDCFTEFTLKWRRRLDTSPGHSNHGETSASRFPLSFGFLNRRHRIFYPVLTYNQLIAKSYFHSFPFLPQFFTMEQSA